MKPKQFLIHKSAAFFRQTVERIPPLMGKESLHLVALRGYEAVIRFEFLFLLSSRLILELEEKVPFPALVFWRHISLLLIFLGRLFLSFPLVTSSDRNGSLCFWGVYCGGS